MSFIRKWVETKHTELEYSNEISPENLFAGLMYGLVSFGRDDPRRKKDEKLQTFGIDITKHYSGDATLFELGCYLHFRVDLWLFRNKPNLRNQISTTYIKEFIKLFTRALGQNDLLEIFEQRVDKYGELIRKGEELQEYHFYLSELIFKTKDNAPPKIQNLDHMPVILKGFLEDTFLKMELISWEKHILPAILDSLNRYCALLEKKL